GLVREELAPFLVGLEPLLATFFPNRLVVLYAHLYPDKDGHFDREGIQDTLQYLADECRVLPLPEALKRLEEGKGLPRRAVAIIVDDATQKFFQFGHGLLSASGLPYTLAVVPGLIQGGGKEHLLARLMRIAGHPYWLPNQEMLERVLAWFGDEDSRERASFDTVFSKASALAEDALGELLEHIRALDHQFMTWEELKEVQTRDEVHFASHSMSHPQMRFAIRGWLEWELARSKALLEENLEVGVQSFVVPYGHPRQLTPAVSQALVKSGYRYAFLTRKGTVGTGTMRYTMPRLALEDEPWRLRVHTCPAVCSLIYPTRKGGEHMVGVAG
ncbi:MAG: polysaccharide deacetylase family protein, partial [Chloroflexota bacterium]